MSKQQNQTGEDRSTFMAGGQHTDKPAHDDSTEDSAAKVVEVAITSGGPAAAPIHQQQHARSVDAASTAVDDLVLSGNNGCEGGVSKHAKEGAKTSNEKEADESKNQQSTTPEQQDEPHSPLRNTVSRRIHGFAHGVSRRVVVKKSPQQQPAQQQGGGEKDHDTPVNNDIKSNSSSNNNNNNNNNNNKNKKRGVSKKLTGFAHALVPQGILLRRAERNNAKKMRNQQHQNNDEEATVSTQEETSSAACVEGHHHSGEVSSFSNDDVQGLENKNKNNKTSGGGGASTPTTKALGQSSDETPAQSLVRLYLQSLLGLSQFEDWWSYPLIPMLIFHPITMAGFVLSVSMSTLFVLGLWDLVRIAYQQQQPQQEGSFNIMIQAVMLRHFDIWREQWKIFQHGFGRRRVLLLIGIMLQVLTTTAATTTNRAQ